ncbi:hypothetical protein GPALN_014392 [Globodera pallida]|nr:hypothetical protein GPALN_014392 [Globodera pallida]
MLDVSKITLILLAIIQISNAVNHPVNEGWRLENELNTGIRQAMNPPSNNSARTSIHAAGHVLCSYNNPKFIETLNYTTIIGENTYFGVTYFMSPKQYDRYSVNELKARMSTFLCGKVAEEIALQLSLEHGNDIIRANEIASQLAKRQNYGESRRILNQEEVKLLDEATATASKFLLQRPPDLKKLASHLLNKKTLNNLDVARLLGRGPKAKQLTTRCFANCGITVM